ncbi:MAG: GFA family protein [Proteobacteria bacterium]|nr:GFA family protein [Pseudomonadota bacterium]
MIEGGCFCGKIRYTIDDGDYRIVNCHCTMCRKTSGAPFVGWVVVPKEAFQCVSGTPKFLQSSDKGRRELCPDCGTPLTFISSDRTEFIDVTTGSLDAPNDFVPTMAVHEESKLTWLGATE